MGSSVSSRLLVLFAISLVGCGSTVDANTFAGDDASSDATTDATTDSTTTETGDDAAASETSPDAPIASDTAPDVPPSETGPGPTTLDNVCTRLAAVICANPTQNCCTRRSIPYDSAGCQTGIGAWCGGLVSQVKAAQRTFNASAFDACATAWQSLETTCSVPFVDYAKTYAPCEQLFPGTVPAGSACGGDADCIAPPGGVSFCGASSKTCSTMVVVGQNQACSYDQTSLKLCDKGLYCPAQLNAKCKTVTPLGGACTGPNDLSCGLGNQCGQTSTGSYQCKLGLPSGAQCTNNLQCASWSCNGASPSSAGACTDPYAEMASPAICEGVP
jgi:hypothetical protein